MYSFLEPEAVDLEMQRCLDETSIRNQIARFDDAIMRHDVDAFKRLWVADAHWTVSAPMIFDVQGIKAIIEAFQALSERYDAIANLTSWAIVEVERDTATARSATQGIYRSHTTGEYQLTGQWQDVLHTQEDGGWRFVSRRYRSI